jgi:hypothetical protein
VAVVARAAAALANTPQRAAERPATIAGRLVLH